MKKLFGILALALLIISSNGIAKAYADAVSDYPKKEITIVVPWNPGGTNDLMARAMQPVFKKMYDVDIVVKNVPGGGSAVGILEAQNARPDGYTLGIATSSYIALVAQGRVAAPLDSAANMMGIAEEPVCMVIKNNGKYASAQDVINATKAASGQISVGIPGSNNVNQAYATLLQEKIGAEFNFIAFDGGSRVVAELIGGHIDCGILKPSEVMNQIKAGELKIVGVFNKNGIPLLPEVPTFDSLGYDVFRLGNIQQMAYLMGPKKIDPAIQAKIIEMFTGVIKSGDYRKFADSVGIVINPISGDEFTEYFKEVSEGLEKASKDIFTK